MVSCCVRDSGSAEFSFMQGIFFCFFVCPVFPATARLHCHVCFLSVWLQIIHEYNSFHIWSRGEVSDYVLMEGRGFGFVTYKDPQNAQQFLEVAVRCRFRFTCAFVLISEEVLVDLNSANNAGCYMASCMACSNGNMSSTERKLRPRLRCPRTLATAPC